MTDQTDRTAALAEIGRAEAAANVARALTVFDALDDQAPRLTASDRYDAAFAAWQTCMDVDWPVDDVDTARLAIRASHHMPEEALIDLVDVQYGEHEKWIRVDEQHALVWLPEDDALILTFPTHAGRVIDAVLARPRTRA